MSAIHRHTTTAQPAMCPAGNPSASAQWIASSPCCTQPSSTCHEARLPAPLPACLQDYNDRLFTGLLILSLAVVVVFRFLLKVQVRTLHACSAPCSHQRA